MNKSRDIKSGRHGGNRPNVINVAVGKKYRGRHQVLLADYLKYPVDTALTRIHDDARLPRGGGDHVAVRGPWPCGKACDEHLRKPSAEQIRGRIDSAGGK